MTMERGTLATTVARLRASRGWSYAVLARQAGLDQTTVWKIETGKTPNPGSETLVKISNALGVSLLELTGERPMPRRRTEIDKGVARLPLRTLRVQADGRPDWDDTQETILASVHAVAGRTNAFAAVVTGHCMVPHIMPGDVVLIDPDRRYRNGDMVVVTDGSGATMVKWFRVDANGGGYLRAADGTELRPEDAKIEGVVFRVERDAVRDPEV